MRGRWWQTVAAELLVVGIPLWSVLMAHPTAFSFAVPAAVAACVLLPLRLRWPRLVAVAVLPALAGGLGWPAAIVALYRIGRVETRIRYVVAWVAVSFLAMALPVQFVIVLSIPDRIMSMMFALVALGSPAALGALVRLRGELSASLDEVRRARQAEMEARLEQARSAERTRIAREIHDAVGHNATLIAIQAAALAATTTDPEAVQTANRLRELARQSLAEMRAALGLVTADQRLQGLSDLPALLERARHAGVDVEFDGEPEASNSSPVVGRAVYRVVQEGLTNALKHAPGAPVRVRLIRESNRVIVSVVNDATTAAIPQDLDSGGLGLAGLSERVRTAGGTLRVQRLPGGGFSILADLPAHNPPKVVSTGPTLDGGASPLVAS